jgi:hypothetical protein
MRGSFPEFLLIGPGHVFAGPLIPARTPAQTSDSAELVRLDRDRDDGNGRPSR